MGASGKDLLAPRGSSIDLAMTVFKKFFKAKTGMEWEERHDDAKIPEQKKDMQGQPVPANEGWYQYERPTGLLASLRIAAEVSSMKKETQTMSQTADTAATNYDTVDITSECGENHPEQGQDHQDSLVHHQASVDSDSSDANDTVVEGASSSDELINVKEDDKKKDEQQQQQQQSNPESPRRVIIVID